MLQLVSELPSLHLIYRDILGPQLAYKDILGLNSSRNIFWASSSILRTL